MEQTKHDFVEQAARLNTRKKFIGVKAAMQQTYRIAKQTQVGYRGEFWTRSSEGGMTSRGRGVFLGEGT